LISTQLGISFSGGRPDLPLLLLHSPDDATDGARTS